MKSNDQFGLKSNDRFGLKKPTIYSKNYTFLFRDGNIWPKYAILSAFTQLPYIQRLTFKNKHFTPLIPPDALRKMAFRTAKHARSHRQTCPIEPRLGVFRNSKHARWQNQRAVSTMKWGKNGGFIRWFIKNPEPTFLPKYPTNQGFHPNPTSISYTLLT